MRVDVGAFAERRDSLDQRWHRFLLSCDLIAVPVPNCPESALATLKGMGGLVLSGGNTLYRFGGDAAERDATEQAILESALERKLPVIGVCRGMQFLANYFKCAISRIPDHVGRVHTVQKTDGRERRVNSFHEYGVFAVGDAIIPVAIATDGSVEAFRHASLPIYGIMWHPEREDDPHFEDKALFRDLFRASH